MRRVGWLALIVAIQPLGCATPTSSTVLVARGYDIYEAASGRYLGSDQVTWLDSKWMFGATDFVLRRPGCKDGTYTIKRTDRLDAGAVVLSVLLSFGLILPLLPAGYYSPTYTVPFPPTACHATD